MDSNLLATLMLGAFLGIRHSLDPDHLMAISTITTKSRNPLNAVWVGLSWGLGHTTTLFILGSCVIALRITIPDHLLLIFEMAVGALLVFLGLQVLWQLWKRKVHVHPHAHLDMKHQHFHNHIKSLESQEHHSIPFFGRPFLRPKSFIIGSIHGVAGTATLMLIVLATLKSVWAGIFYILLFGIGSMLSMAVVTVALSLPFSTSARFPKLNRRLRFTAGFGSVLFGTFLMYQVGIVQGLLHFSI